MARISKLKLGNFNKETYAIYLALRHPHTPQGAKLLALITLIYFFVPFDIVTDVIPVIGWIDDFAIGFILTRVATSMVPAHIMEQSRLEAARKHKNIMRILIPVLLGFLVICILLLVLIVKALQGLF